MDSPDPLVWDRLLVGGYLHLRKHYEMYYLSMFTLIAGCEWTLVLIPVVPVPPPPPR